MAGGKFLTARQEQFVLAYLKTGHGTDAYRAAYTTSGMNESTIQREATRLMAHPKIAKRLATIVKPIARKAGLDLEETMAQARRVGQFDIRKCFDAQGRLIPLDLLDEDTAMAIDRVVRDKDSGEVIGYIASERMKALDMAFKYLGLYERDNRQKSDNLALQVVLVQPKPRAIEDDD